MSVADHIRTTGSAVTAITGAVAVVVFFARLDGRMSRLEEQVHTLSLAPTLSAAIDKGGSASPQLTPNPVAQACADLAKRSAEETIKGFLLNSDRIQKTMSDIGCTRSP